MFSLFKKKFDKSTLITSLIPEIIDIQLSVGAIKSSQLSEDLWALGYILGFHDGILQKLEINDDIKEMALMAVSYSKIFNNVALGARLFKQSCDMQSDEVFREGLLVGGGEVFQYLKDKTPPMGLALHLQNNY